MLFEQTSPQVEGLSMEEAFLDVRGLEHISGSPRQIAVRLRHDAREQVGLPITVGVARTKVLAKMASRAAKPDGLLVLAPERELDFLHRLRVEELWGVGPATAKRLHAAGITEVRQVASLDESVLVSILGRASGRHLHAIARNRDPRPVRGRRGRRSVGSQSALDRSSHSPAALDTVLIAVVERVARRMRAGGRVGRTIVLRLRFADYARATRSRTLAEPTATTRVILRTARALLAEAMPLIERRGVTLIGVSLHGLGSNRAGVQLTLPLDRDRRDYLDAALDSIRDRFGPTAITRAALLGRGERSTAWLLPGDRATVLRSPSKGA